MATATSTVPAACAHVVAVIEVLLPTAPVAATLPIFTLAPDWMFVPVMVTGGRRDLCCVIELTPGTSWGGGGEVEEFPPSQEISPKEEKSAEDANAKSWVEYFGRRKDKKKSRQITIVRVSQE